MPNWCDNQATITHEDKSKIDAIEATLKAEEKELFKTIYPRPDDQEENWYDWNVNNWGTKWEASIIDWERCDDNSIFVCFETAWSPPVNLYESMNITGYSVSAVYNEPGMGFAGQWIDGEDDYYDYDITDLESIESLPSDVVEFADLISQHEYWKENETEVD
jgi:hypothetical protein